MTDDQRGKGSTGAQLRRRRFLTGIGLAAATPAASQLLVPAPGWAAPAQASRDEARWQVCQRLARELLLVGSNGEDLKLQYLKILIDRGLPKTNNPKKVLVVGAGITGLVAGLLLKQAGHQVTIIEANGNRIGGRIKTFRAGPETAGEPAPFSDAHQYAEAGAMRLPDFYPMTLALIDKLGLKRQLFFNVDIARGSGNQNALIPPVVYQSFTGQRWRNGPDSPGFRSPDVSNRTWIRTNGRQARRAEYSGKPELINRGFGVPPAQLRVTSGRLLDDVLDPVRDYYSVRTSDGGRANKPLSQWIDGWARVLYDFDGYSMGSFLTDYAELDERTVDLIGTVENLTSRIPLSFIHSFLTRSLVSAQNTYWEIVGGTAMLPYALLPLLRNQIRMNRRMVQLDYWTPESTSQNVRANGPRVWVKTVTESGGDDAVSGSPGAEAEIFTADAAIVTIPFAALRHVEVNPLFSYGKRRAVIELHYDSATKVLLEFSKRWWEFSEADWKRELNAKKPGLYEHYRTVDDQPAAETVGGGSVTDGPNRFMYFPSHPVPNGKGGGVVLASYSWADDAARWDSMDDKERYAYALRGLQTVYGTRIEAFYTGVGRTQSWLRNRYAFGEAAVFTPRQLTELHPSIPTPEGPVHFAGEHTSLKHSWIEGALESAVRTAQEVNAPR